MISTGSLSKCTCEFVFLATCPPKYNFILEVIVIGSLNEFLLVGWVCLVIGTMLDLIHLIISLIFESLHTNKLYVSSYSE